jgi:predicted RNase H-like HicB family nuclease
LRVADTDQNLVSFSSSFTRFSMSARLILVVRVRPKLSRQNVRVAFWQIIWQISSMKLTAVIYPDVETDWLVAECPEIGTASQGKTEEEALANLREATELYLESFPRALKKESAVRSFELAHA